MTERELSIFEQSATLLRSFVDLVESEREYSLPTDVEDFVDGVHGLQRQILARIARRTSRHERVQLIFKAKGNA